MSHGAPETNRSLDQQVSYFVESYQGESRCTTAEISL
jgi:hypothetical protein